MANTVVVMLLLVSLVVTAVLGAYTLLKCDSRKSAPFMAILASAFLYTLGYLLQTAAGSLERVSMAFPVTFIGAAYIAPAYMYFVAEYCEAKIGRWIASLLIGVPFVYILLVFTTDSHGLILASYEYITNTPVRYLAITPGPLYYVLHAYSVAVAVATAVLTISRFSVQSPKYRANLLLLMLGAAFFIIMDLLFLFKITPYGVNLVHSSTTVLVLLLYYCIMRYNLIDITPIASEMALASVRDAFILVDRDNRLLRTNCAARALFPRLAKMEKGSPISQIENWPAELTLWDGRETVAFAMGDDNYYTASVNTVASRKGRVLGCTVIIQDITESVRLTKRLEEMAYTDSLTGIYTRRYFLNQVTAQFERLKRMGDAAHIVIFDVDHFKQINDTYGHIIGDEALKMVADRVCNAIRPYDLFGRYGGEEFILYVPDISEEGIECYMNRLRLAICDTPIGVEDVRLTVTASFGAARLTPEGGIDQAIKVADGVLYAAKKGGRNMVVSLSPKQ